MTDELQYDSCMYRREIKRNGEVHRYACGSPYVDDMSDYRFTDMTFAKFVCKFHARSRHCPSTVGVMSSMAKLLEHLDIPREFTEKIETISSDDMKSMLIEKWLDERETKRVLND